MLSRGLFLRQLGVALRPADDALCGDDDTLQKRAALQIVLGRLVQRLLGLRDDATEPQGQGLFVVDDHVAKPAVRARYVTGRHLALGHAQSLGVRPPHLIAQRVAMPVVPDLRRDVVPRQAIQVELGIDCARRQPGRPLPHQQAHPGG